MIYGNGDLPQIWLSDKWDTLMWRWEDLLDWFDRKRHD
jgi:hypothetical protein